MPLNLSEEVKYDAWHQFAVVNPLRYLGLIDEKKGGKGPFQIKTDILKRYSRNLNSLLEEKDWRKVANIDPKQMNHLNKNILNKLEFYKINKEVEDSSNMKTGEKLLILKI